MKYSPSILLQKVIRRLRLYKQQAVLLRRKLIHRPKTFEDGYSLQDNTQVTLYTDRDDLFTGYPSRIRPASAKKKQRVTVALIAVVKNEEATAGPWFDHIMHQTRVPDEIVIVDTGSTDGTVLLLNQLAERSPVKINIFEAPGMNIAQGRNLAVRSATAEHIAVTDFGTKARQDWLERLIFPFEHNPQTEVSGGWYETVGENGQPYHWQKWISLLGKNPQEILSPSVSIAFTRTAWMRAGGYPEWLTLTGEDTYFDLELKRTCRRWAFSPEALVEWEAPNSIWAYWKKMYRWSTGDGETGMRATAYWYAAIVSALTFAGVTGSLFLLLLGWTLNLPILLYFGVLVILIIILRAVITGRKAGYSPSEVVLVIGILAAQALGFLRGTFRREEVTRKRLQGARSIFFMFAGIPVDDTGGGARSTQIALELLRRQIVVCYVHKFPKAESVDLQLQIRHPNLFTFPASEFSLQDFLTKYDLDLAKHETGVLVELPHAEWLPLIGALKQKGAKVVYDLIDEWDSHLGELWYKREAEIATAQKADALVATAPVLKSYLEKISGRPVVLLPNAVNLGLFNRHKQYAVPNDLPRADQVIIYFGALYGSWFDWDLLVKVARANPQAAVVVIGDYRGQCPVTLPNLHFLGLKAQSSLPAYLAHSTVAIIPWKVNDITRATSPLKLYEYLAMHVPVVVPDLPLLRGVPSIYLSEDHEAFVCNIKVASENPLDHTALDNFALQNSWEARVNDLIRLMGIDL